MKQAQVILEAVVGFVLLVVFVLGIIGLWVWGDVKLADRQQKYRASRKSSANWLQNADIGEYPLEKLKDLDEKEVIGGNPWG